MFKEHQFWRKAKKWTFLMRRSIELSIQKALEASGHGGK